MERHRRKFWEEACLLANLNHPNVLRFYGVITASQVAYCFLGVRTRVGLRVLELEMGFQ